MQEWRRLIAAWLVSALTLAPVVVLGWMFSHTRSDLLGMIPWIVFALLLAGVSWFFVSGRAARLGLL
jgi:hypothetical protein